jgi:hypothetical protein
MLEIPGIGFPLISLVCFAAAFGASTFMLTFIFAFF